MSSNAGVWALIALAVVAVSVIWATTPTCRDDQRLARGVVGFVCISK